MKKTLLLLLAFGLFALQSTKAQVTATLAADIATGIDPGMPSYLTAFNGKLYFVANDNTFDQELYEYNGTTATKININASGPSSPSNLIVFNSKLYFYANQGTGEASELMVYDGTNSPSIVADINPGAGFSNISDLIVFDDTLYFNADDGINGMSLWKYDGTNSPTMVAGSAGIDPREFVVYNDKLYFSATDASLGIELFMYDNVPLTAPAMVEDINTGSANSFPSFLTVFNGNLVFSANNGVNGIELLQYNGTTVSLAADINVGASGSAPSELTTYKTKLYFSADDGINGTELFVYDGTTASMVQDIWVGGAFDGSNPTSLIAYRDTLYFSADGDGTGPEIWHYGGTGSPWGENLNTTTGGSYMSSPAIYNNKLYFNADNGTTGGELFYINTCFTTSSTISPMSCGNYTSPSGLVKTTSQTFVDVIPNYIGCDSLITVNLTINTPPTASITGTTAVCQNSVAPTITFTGANGVAPYTFYYKINGGTTQSIVTTVGNSVTLAAPTGTAGVFSYELQSVTAAGCSQNQTGTAVVTVNAKPTASITGSTAVCSGVTAPGVTFTVSGGVNPYTLFYKRVVALNGGVVPGGTSNQTLTIPTGNSDIVYVPSTDIQNIFTYLLDSVQDGNSCKQALTGNAVVEIYPKPKVNLGADIFVLTPSPQTLNAKNVGSTYLWNTSATTQIINPSAAGNYSVIVTNSLGCVGKDTININLTGPTTIFVNDNAAGANNGTTWANAYTNLTTALTNARNGDSIFVAAGTYQPTDEDGFNLKENVKIYGGFAGTESYIYQRNLTLPNTSILKGNSGVVVYSGSGITTKTIVDGFTITEASSLGAGVRIINSSPIIKNCIIKDNECYRAGGVQIWNYKSKPILINCVIANNSSQNIGGGIDNHGTPTFINCVITNNSTFTINLGQGIYSEGSEARPAFYNCIIYGNSAGEVTAGVYSNDIAPSPIIKNCLIQGKRADATNHNLDGTPTNLDLFVDAANGNYRLKPTAIAVNAGSNALLSAGLTKDLAGNTRTFDGNVDMGAYELQTVQPPLDGVICVKPGGAGLMNGNGWANAFANLQAAIDLSATTTTKVVAVAVGTYTLATNQSFVMKEGVKIMGGFVGTETHINQRNLSVTSYTTVLKGNGSAVINNDGNNLTNAAVLDGFTITGGVGRDFNYYVRRAGMLIHRFGGGIYNYNSSPTIINCKITGNTAEGDNNRGAGGGIYNKESSTKIINCIISNNSAGAIYEGGDMFTSDGCGGAIYSVNSTNVKIINCSINKNSSNGSSAAIVIRGGNGTDIINCSIANNFSDAISGLDVTKNAANSKFVNIKNSIIYGNTSEFQTISTANPNLYGLESCLISNSLIGGQGADATYNNANGTVNLPYVFMDAANGDLRLNFLGNLFSGVINGGSDAAITGYDTDLDGNNRKNKAVDMGCYELGASKPSNITVSNNPNWVIKNSRNILSDLQLGNPEQKDLQSNFALLQLAIDAAYPGDSIYVEKGIYEQGVDTALVMKEGVHIFGGFNGTETNFAERDLNAGYATVLRGTGTSVIINNDNGLTTAAELNGFTLENGTGFNVDGLLYGGAIYNYKASPTISNCKIQNNTADYGAAIFNDDSSSPNIVRCQLLSNNATFDGAAVYSNYNSAAKITNCLVKNNNAGNNGGAVYANFMSDNKIVNSTIVNNNAAVDGGAIVANSSNIKMSNSIALNNTATSNAGVYNYNSGVTDVTYSLTQGITTGTGNLDGTTTYTLFVNESANNYRLKCGVAVIDAGRNDSIPTNGNIDLAQNNRTYDSTVDLGAYEYGAFAKPKATSKEPICVNGTKIFRSNISDATGATYQWFKAPVGVSTFTAIGSAIKDSLLLSAVAQADSGSRYYVQITNGCGVLNSDTMTLKVNKLPVVNLGSDRGVCANINPVLNANNYGEMLWNDGTNNSTLPLLNSGAYSLQVTDVNGCVATDAVNIIVNTLDTLVNVNLSTLSSAQANAASYQWIKWDAGTSTYTVISGATTQSYTATSNGDYAVIVNTAEGCVDTSTYKTIVNVSIKENTTSKSILGVYPNPTNGELTISANEDMQLIEITDVVGRAIYIEKPFATKHTINLANEPKGVYFVKVKSDKGSDVVKVIKQ